MRNIKEWFLYFVPLTIGMILFSQGMSFGRWNEFNTIEHYINLHSLMIASGGVGLMFLAIALFVVMKRINNLEKR